MTIGDKIRKYRTLRGLTQEELGNRLGMKRDRIRQYETGVRTPKADLLEKIAEQLDVDVASLSDIDIRDDEDLMHVLFDAENKYKIEVIKNNGQTMLVFDDSDLSHSAITTYLSLWSDKRKALGITKDNIDASQKKNEYEDWQGQFGTQAEAFKSDIKNRIEKKYAPLTGKSSKDAGSTSDIIRILKQLEPGILIDTTYNNGNPGLIFDVEEVLKEDRESFAKFLIKLKSIESLGAKVQSDIIYNGTQIMIAYYFPYPGFSVITSIAEDLITYNKNISSYSYIAKEEYEKHLESNMKTYDMDVKSIIQEGQKKT